MTRVGMALFLLIVGLLMVTGVLPTAVISAATEEYSENFNVDTGEGETEAICTVAYDHYYDDLTDLDATSNNESHITV